LQTPAHPKGYPPLSKERLRDDYFPTEESKQQAKDATRVVIERVYGKTGRDETMDKGKRGGRADYQDTIDKSKGSETLTIDSESGVSQGRGMHDEDGVDHLHIGAGVESPSGDPGQHRKSELPPARAN